MHIERMTFSILFLHESVSFNNSRIRIVSMIEYHKHLMFYKNARFARHSIFRYWAFNTQMRHQIDDYAKWFIRLNSNKMTTIEKLRILINDLNSHLKDMIIRKTVNLRDTRLYWNAISSELKIMIKNLNEQTLFFTVSATNLQWRDLYKHMSDVKQINDVIEIERNRLTWRLLRKNSHIAIEYLYRRWNLFLRTVFKNKFEMLNHWYRFEWQSKESEHIHEFVWMNAFSMKQKQKYLTYWESLMTVMNSKENVSLASVHLCSKSFAQRVNTRRELIELFNRVKRHIKCISVYCLRKMKKIEEQICRFHFFRSLQFASTIDNVMNLKYEIFNATRNDLLMKNYNFIYSLKWLTNVNVNSCIDQNVVLTYIVKYCIKVEVKSLFYKELLKSMLSDVTFKAFMLSLFIKLMNKLIIERDYSSQKVLHHFMNFKLKSCFRNFIIVDVRFIDNQKRMMTRLASEDIISSQTYLKKYCNRNSAQTQLILIIVARYHDYVKDVFVLRLKIALKIVRLFSHYFFKIDDRDYENFCRVKMMLHHFFRDTSFTDLLRNENEFTFDIWQKAYQYCQNHHHYHESNSLNASTTTSEIATSDVESKIESLNDQEKSVNVENISKSLLQRHSQRDELKMSSDFNFDQRDMNKKHDWLQSKTYSVNMYAFMNHIKTQKVKIEQTVASISLKEIDDVTILNREQRQIFDRVMSHYFVADDTQLLFQMNDQASTEKFKVIDLIFAHLTFYATQDSRN